MNDAIETETIEREHGTYTYSVFYDMNSSNPLEEFDCYEEGDQAHRAWLDGEVYGWVLECEGDPITGDQLDSCWGYYGDGERDYMRECALDTIAYIEPERAQGSQAVA